MSNQPRQKHFSEWILATLKTAPGLKLSRQRLWHLYRVDPSFQPTTDTSAGFSVALKTLLSNGKLEVIFENEAKTIRLK